MARRPASIIRFLFPRSPVLAGACTGAVLGIAAVVLTASVLAATRGGEVGPLAFIYGFVYGMPCGAVIGAAAALVTKIVLADQRRVAERDARGDGSLTTAELP